MSNRIDSEDTPFSSGRYARPPEEYVRPARRTLLHVSDLPCPRTTVQGLFAYHHVLDEFGDWQPLDLELVPEPGNPWDSHAVSVEFDGRRIGYLDRSLAEDWHDCLRFLNKRGFAGYAIGEARLSRTQHIWVTLEIPGTEALWRFAHNVGVFAECDAVLSQLDRGSFERLVDSSSDGIPDDLAAMIEARKGFAPTLSWSSDTTLSPYQRIPKAIVLRLQCIARTRVLQLRQRAQEARQRARHEADMERQRRRTAKADERSRLLEEVKERTASGGSQREIAVSLGCSVSLVSALQKEAGIKPAQWAGNPPK